MWKVFRPKVGFSRKLQAQRSETTFEGKNVMILSVGQGILAKISNIVQSDAEV